MAQKRGILLRTEQNREKWVDNIKAICMIFIVMSHLPYCPEELRHFFTPFFLSGFYFSSGYVMKPLPILKFALKKAKTILWPWLIFSAVEIVIIAIFGNHETTLAGYIFYTLLQVKDLHESLWFFPSLFVTLMVVDFLVLKFDVRKLLPISICMLFVSRLYGMLMPQNLLPWNSVCLPWHLHNVGTTSFFVILGYLYKKYQVNERVKKYISVALPLLIIIYLIELYITRDAIEIGIWNYPEFFIWLLVMGTGLAMVIVIAQVDGLKNSRVFTYIGRNTLLYYALHQNLCRLIYNVLEKIDWGYSFSQTSVGQWGFTALFTSLILLILFVPIEFIKKKMNYLIRFPW